MGEGKAAEIRKTIVSAATPGEAKKIANKEGREFGDEDYWRNWEEERKLLVMRRGLKEKFKQNEKLGAHLIATGNSYLIEDNPRDAYW